jgi:hypothetical protein
VRHASPSTKRPNQAARNVFHTTHPPPWGPTRPDLIRPARPSAREQPHRSRRPAGSPYPRLIRAPDHPQSLCSSQTRRKGSGIAPYPRPNHSQSLCSSQTSPKGLHNGAPSEPPRQAAIPVFKPDSAGRGNPFWARVTDVMPPLGMMGAMGAGLVAGPLLLRSPANGALSVVGGTGGRTVEGRGSSGTTPFTTAERVNRHADHRT